MGFYQRHILPRLIHGGMRQAQLKPLRSSLIEAARGRVLEVGIGSGLNIPFYRRDVVQVIGIDPSRALLAKARRAAAWSRCPVRLLEGCAETLPLASGSIDHVVMTWTLCSVADPLGALGEIRRVLRPGGALLFIEHGKAADDDPGVQRWQERITPLWRRFAGHCHLNRRVDQLLVAAGFEPTSLDCGYMVKGPKILTFHYRGRA
ncbi:MAG: class I SAM-dependent methyltransferase, partial [Alphaproteobacteria bacterium]|nr:class I SAM-dependent methyltransferase [Alphaproteobacteria bacterium]